MTSQTNATTGESAVYTWDLEQRLASATIHRRENDAAGGDHAVDVETAFTYDDTGFRVARAASVRVDGAATLDQSRTYLPDADNPSGYTQAIEESTASGVDRSYLIGHRILAQADAGGTSWLLPDGHGSTRLLTDATGAVTDRFWYDAWGNPRTPQPNVVTSVRTPHLYTGEHFDLLLGLEYLRARWYAPTLAAFTRMDSLRLVWATNPFHFSVLLCSFRTDKHTDPTGRMTLLGQMFTMGMLGALSGAITGYVTTSTQGVSTADRLWCVAVSTLAGFLIAFCNFSITHLCS